MIDEKKLLQHLNDWAMQEAPFTEEQNRDEYDVIMECIKAVEEQPKADWIPCEVKMPKERDSMFAKAKGTDKWNDAMFEKISDEVNVTVVSEKGDAATTHAHTKDGKWSCDLLKVNKTYRVIAWQPLPEPYQPKEDES